MLQVPRLKETPAATLLEAVRLESNEAAATCNPPSEWWWGRAVARCLRLPLHVHPLPLQITNVAALMDKCSQSPSSKPYRCPWCPVSMKTKKGAINSVYVHVKVAVQHLRRYHEVLFNALPAATRDTLDSANDASVPGSRWQSIWSPSSVTPPATVAVLSRPPIVPARVAPRVPEVPTAVPVSAVGTSAETSSAFESDLASPAAPPPEQGDTESSTSRVRFC